MDRVINRQSYERDEKEAAERLPPDNIERWERVWQASGIRLGSMSAEGFLGEPRIRTLGIGGRQDPLKLAHDHGLRKGDLVALRDADQPTEANQYLVEVGEVRRSTDGGVNVWFEPPLPRSAWPAPMREATVPTSIYVEPVLSFGESVIEVMDGNGKVLWGASCDPGTSGELADRLETAVRVAADMGHSDAFTGRRRSFEIVAGRIGRDRRWQMSDGLGGITDIEPRGMFEARPSAFAKAVLTVTVAGYVEGFEEGLGRKADMELLAETRHIEAPAPAM